MKPSLTVYFRSLKPTCTEASPGLDPNIGAAPFSGIVISSIFSESGLFSGFSRRGGDGCGVEADVSSIAPKTHSSEDTTSECFWRQLQRAIIFRIKVLSPTHFLSYLYCSYYYFLSL